MLRRSCLILSLALLTLPACRRDDAASPRAQAPAAVTAFYPTTFFAERIGGPDVPVTCICPPDVDPISWMPPRDAVGVLQTAPLVILNGAGYEAWASIVSLPPSRTVDTSAPFRAEYLTFPAITHSHGAGGQHTHQGTDGHTWLDPRNAATQADEVRAAFARLWPAKAPDFARRADDLREELLALDTRLRSLTPRAATARILASHPAYQYLARRYTLTITNVDLPPDADPSEDQWAAVEKALGDHEGPRVILFEEEPLPGTAERLRARLHADPVLFDPCEQPTTADFTARMNANIDRLEAALTPPTAKEPK